MRRAFQWLYGELDCGRTRRSILRRAAKSEGTKAAVRDSFRLLDQLALFDRQSAECALLGLDEVGRGPLAGPLVAACVQLPYPTVPALPFLRDSKKLKASEREFLAERIKAVAVHIGYGVVEACEFGGELNLHQLTFLAMARALESLPREEDSHFLLVDGKFSLPQWTCAQRAVIQGDDKSLSIAAASVLAKVYRDQIMSDLDRSYPEYGFAQHVGYGTESHRQAILTHGPCPQHRSNFLAKVLSSTGPH